MGFISIIQSSAIYIVIVSFVVYGAYQALPYVLDSIDQINERRYKNRTSRGSTVHEKENNCNQETNT